MGGVPIDENAATALPGLFAAGEVSAGAHGANRLSNNAFTEAHTLGWRAGKAASLFARRTGAGAQVADLARRGVERVAERGRRAQRPVELIREIKRVCWEEAGIVREGELLEGARGTLAEAQRGLASCGGAEPARLLEAFEAENLCLSARAVVEAALTRTESRGAHYRADYPETDEADWRMNVFVRLEGEAMRAQKRSVGAHAWADE